MTFSITIYDIAFKLFKVFDMDIGSFFDIGNLISMSKLFLFRRSLFDNF